MKKISYIIISVLFLFINSVNAEELTKNNITFYQTDSSKFNLTCTYADGNVVKLAYNVDSKKGNLTNTSSISCSVCANDLSKETLTSMGFINSNGASCPKYIYGTMESDKINLIDGFSNEPVGASYVIISNSNSNCSGDCLLNDDSVGSCYLCGGSNHAYYKWGDTNPDSNSCRVVDKEKSKCSGYYNQIGTGTTGYKSFTCGSIEKVPVALKTLIPNIVTIIKVFVPILLIILGMVDFLKAVMAQDDKAMNESKSKFLRRLIAAVAVFLVITIVQSAFLIINTDDTNSMAGCIDCLINGHC